MLSHSRSKRQTKSSCLQHLTKKRCIKIESTTTRVNFATRPSLEKLHSWTVTECSTAKDVQGRSVTVAAREESSCRRMIPRKSAYATYVTLKWRTTSFWKTWKKLRGPLIKDLPHLAVIKNSSLTAEKQQKLDSIVSVKIWISAWRRNRKRSSCTNRSSWVSRRNLRRKSMLDLHSSKARRIFWKSKVILTKSKNDWRTKKQLWCLKRFN